MATHPDENPDSVPNGPSTDVEQVTPPDGNERESVEDVPADSAPDSAGTGDTHHREDRAAAS